jgi:hypothetical protein
VDFRFVDPHFGYCKIKQHLQSSIICWEIASSKKFFLEWQKKTKNGYNFLKKKTRINPYQTVNSIGEMLSQNENLNFKWIDFRGVYIYIYRERGFQSQKKWKKCITHFYFLWWLFWQPHECHQGSLLTSNNAKKRISQLGNLTL